MSDASAFEWIRSAVVPVLTAATTITLFWLKLHADSRKKLDDLLIELEHEIYNPTTQSRSAIFRKNYLEIRKAAVEFERWLVDPLKKRELRRALEKFRGQIKEKEDLFSLRGTKHEPLLDTFLTGHEVRCNPPADSEFVEYVDRIAGLRKVTGSRRWRDPESPTV